MSWPTVTHDDVPPKGTPGECFWCHEKIGSEHARSCVRVQRRVRLRYVFEIDVMMPHDWTPDQILFHRNESTWCAGNAIEEIEDACGKDGCPCAMFHAEFVEIVDDTPTTRERPQLPTTPRGKVH